MSVFAAVGYQEEFYPVSGIERIGAERKNREGLHIRHIKVRGKDDSLELHRTDADQLLLTIVQLMPALPGTSVLRAWLDDGVPCIGRTNVIAWGLCVDGQVRPVTPQGIGRVWSSPDDMAYLEMPDGSVEATCPYAEPVFYADAEAYAAGEGQRLAEELAERQRAAGAVQP